MASSFTLTNNALQDANVTWSVEELLTLLKDASPDIQNKLRQGFTGLESAFHSFSTEIADYDNRNTALRAENISLKQSASTEFTSLKDENAALKDKIHTLKDHIADLSLQRPAATAPATAPASAPPASVARARQKDPKEFTGSHEGNESHKKPRGVSRLEEGLDTQV